MRLLYLNMEGRKLDRTQYQSSIGVTCLIQHNAVANGGVYPGLLKTVGKPWIDGASSRSKEHSERLNMTTEVGRGNYTSMLHLWYKFVMLTRAQ